MGTLTVLRRCVCAIVGVLRTHTRLAQLNRDERSSPVRHRSIGAENATAKPLLTLMIWKHTCTTFPNSDRCLTRVGWTHNFPVYLLMTVN